MAIQSQAEAVRVVSRTWAHSTHDLFDFEAKSADVSAKSFSLSRSTACFRAGDDVKMGENDLEPSGASVGCAAAGSSAEGLALLTKRRGRFYVDRIKKTQGDAIRHGERLWLVVRDMEPIQGSSSPSNAAAPSGYALAKDDIIKLGRSKFRVCQMVTKADSIEELVLDDSRTICRRQGGVDAEAFKCRICLCEGAEDEEDPLIQPCSCKGSIEHVHLNCLRHWVRGKQNQPRDACGSFFYQPLSCELCKTIYPLKVQQLGAGEKPLDLLELPQPKPPFIVLESASRHFAKQDQGLHVLSLAEGKLLKLGRSHNCDVRINDVSISRCQATIRFHDEQFLLEDNRSKFGTLVAVKKPWALEPGQQVSFQAGRTILSLCAEACEASSKVPEEL